MAGIAGKIAGVYVGASPSKVLGVTDAKFTKNGKEIDTTSWDSNGVEEFILGLQGADCSFNGLYNPADTTGQIVCRDATGAIAVEVRWGATTPKVAFSALVTQWGIDASVSDKVGFSCTLKPTGALSFS